MPGLNTKLLLQTTLVRNLSSLENLEIQWIHGIGLSMIGLQFLLSHIILEPSLNTIHLKSIHPTVFSNESVRFTIGYVQDPIVKFASPTGLKEYLPLWKSYFSTALEMIYFHYQDYAHCVDVSAKLDLQIERDAYKVSRNENYGAIVALSARQAIGGIVFAESAHGRITEGKGSKPLVFLKEISSDGNMQTVDVIFPAYFPLIQHN